MIIPIDQKKKFILIKVQIPKGNRGSVRGNNAIGTNNRFTLISTDFLN